MPVRKIIRMGHPTLRSPAKTVPENSIGSSNTLIEFVEAVNHRWFAVNLDSGNFRTPDPYIDFASSAPYAVNVQPVSNTHLTLPTNREV